MSKIAYDDQSFEMDEVRKQMDAELAEALQGEDDTDQDFFNAYLIAHHERYGERFTIR